LSLILIVGRFCPWMDLTERTTEQGWQPTWQEGGVFFTWLGLWVGWFLIRTRFTARNDSRQERSSEAPPNKQGKDTLAGRPEG
jgi:hypothetical protein